MSKRKETGRKMGLLQIGVSGLIGAVIGGGGSWALLYNQSLVKEFAREAEEGIFRYAPAALTVLSAAACILGAFFVVTAGRKYRKWDQEDSEQAEKLDREYDRNSFFMSLLYILGVILSGIIIEGMNRSGEYEESMFSLLFFLASFFWILGCMDRIVKYQKKLNPEKKGNFLSWAFRKQWLASCDEREKEKIYKAAYKSYTIQQYVYPVIFIALILLSTILKVGILPFIVLGVIWVSLLISYLYEYQKKN